MAATAYPFRSDISAFSGNDMGTANDIYGPSNPLHSASDANGAVLSGDIPGSPNHLPSADLSTSSDIPAASLGSSLSVPNPDSFRHGRASLGSPLFSPSGPSSDIDNVDFCSAIHVGSLRYCCIATGVCMSFCYSIWHDGDSWHWDWRAQILFMASDASLRSCMASRSTFSDAFVMSVVYSTTQSESMDPCNDDTDLFPGMDLSRLPPKI